MALLLFIAAALILFISIIFITTAIKLPNEKALKAEEDSRCEDIDKIIEDALRA